MDLYRNTERNVRPLNIVKDTYEMQEELLQRFVEIARQYELYIDTCAEIGDFHKLRVEHAHCIDKERIERIGGFKLDVDKDTNQRAECGCVASIDIGAYNTCKMVACIVMQIIVKTQLERILACIILNRHYCLEKLMNLI